MLAINLFPFTTFEVRIFKLSTNGPVVQVIDNINGPIIFVHAHKDLEEVEDQDKNGSP